MVSHISDWAMKIALCGCWCLILGAVPGIFYQAPTTGDIRWVAYYCFGVGALLMPFLWPAKQLGSMLLIFQYPWLACFIFIALGIVPCLSPPTVLGGMAFFMSAIVYGIAGYRKEQPNDVDKITRPR